MFRIKKFLALVYIFNLLSKSSIAQLKWNKYIQIEWDDFKSKKLDSSEYSANSSCSIEVSYWHSESKLEYEVNAIFNIDKSWVLNPTPYLLKHERIHFDIAEIYARKIRKYLGSIGNKLVTDLIIDKKIDEFLAARKEYNIYYDKLTNHSLNIKMQVKMEKIIRNELKSLESF